MWNFEPLKHFIYLFNLLDWRNQKQDRLSRGEHSADVHDGHTGVKQCVPVWGWGLQRQTEAGRDQQLDRAA